jgi:hypothetical protein
MNGFRWDVPSRLEKIYEELLVLFPRDNALDSEVRQAWEKTGFSSKEIEHCIDTSAAFSDLELRERRDSAEELCEPIPLP